MSKSTPCSCGIAELHVIARRRTFDEKGIALWSDGSLTGYFGHHIKGLPTGRSQSSNVLDAGWLFMGWIELYELSETAALWQACLMVAKRGGSPGDVRDEFARLKEPRIHFQWTTTMADRDGRWTEQQCRLDRFRWPGVAVFRDRSGYSVMAIEHIAGISRDENPRVIHDEIVKDVGARFTNLRDLTRFLYSFAKTGS